jgi:hypothetical protein
MRFAIRIVAVLAILAGALFVFQGIGVVPGSFMTGRREWAVIGAALVAGALVLIGLTAIMGSREKS